MGPQSKNGDNDFNDPEYILVIYVDHLRKYSKAV
jgi:hypothetical protein